VRKYRCWQLGLDESGDVMVACRGGCWGSWWVAGWLLDGGSTEGRGGDARAVSGLYDLDG
jgi:hypothetical protein